jgi:hypothetical protein
VGTALIGVGAGIAQLADFSTGYARLVLVTISLASLLYFVVRLWQFYWIQRVKILGDQLAFAREECMQRLASEAEKLTMSQNGHLRYLDAIERISDREKPLYTETLEVTVWIGTDDDNDRIVERRVTTPDPLVTNRTIRPIVTTSSGQIARMEDIGFTVKCDDGSVTTLPLREQIGKMRVWLVFEPALTTTTSWTAEYRPRSLWGPLRDGGFDQLTWEDRLQAANGNPSAFTDFVVVFLFPVSSRAPTVRERGTFGAVTEAKRIEQDGRTLWSITWRDSKPAGRRYVWDLIQEVGATAGRPADRVVVPGSRAAPA